jgi:hypothetical protein
MRKHLLSHPTALALIVIAFACSGKKENSEGKEQDVQEEAVGSWEEMDAFHMIMAESYHPYKDSSNLEPARQNAHDLVVSAEKWNSAPLPEKFKEDDEISYKLNQLKADALAFEEVTKTGDDKAIGASLTKLHDLFHQLQEAWYGDHHEH